LEKVKTVALFSGGLDSILAVKLMLVQGVTVEALNFVSPFCRCEGKGGCTISETASNLGVPIKRIPVDQEYLDMLKNPKHGYGRYMNPCIDCRIYMFKKAKDYAEKVGAKLLITGEVLGERPMSQRREALDMIEKEAGLTGKILRPLSAQNFPETDAEIRNQVDRTKFLSITGRSRKQQIELAQQFKINDYPCPSGGCLLTYKEFAAKVQDHLHYKNHLTFNDIHLLKIGRHFRYQKEKIIVGRNKQENQQLLTLKGENDISFEVKGCGSPITILQDPKTKRTDTIAAAVTAKYSDNNDPKVKVNFVSKSEEGIIHVEPLQDDMIDEIRIKWHKPQ
jgi:tRNA U34 2-thiouridine synthase MnmA/TrmU